LSTEIIFETARLSIRTLDLSDAAFYLELVNDPGFIKNIRDKGIRSVIEAAQAIQTAHRDVQEKLGFSLYLVERKKDEASIGLCGFVQREDLPGIDIGYAYLPQYAHQAYALEANLGLLNYAKNTLKLEHLFAIVSPHNLASTNLLEKIGFQLQETIPWKEGGEVKLFSRSLLESLPDFQI